MPPYPSNEARGLMFNQPIITTMTTNHTESVRWHIIKDNDGSVFFTSDRGVKISCDNIDKAKEAFEKLIRNTMDVVNDLLSRDMSTIKFYVEF